MATDGAAAHTILGDPASLPPAAPPSWLRRRRHAAVARPKHGSSAALSRASQAARASGGGFYEHVQRAACVSCPRVTRSTRPPSSPASRPAGQDITDVQFEALIGDINGNCGLYNGVPVKMTVEFIAGRGPADTDRQGEASTTSSPSRARQDNVLPATASIPYIDLPGNRTRNGIRESLDETIPLARANGRRPPSSRLRRDP